MPQELGDIHVPQSPQQEGLLRLTRAQPLEVACEQQQQPSIFSMLLA